MSKKYILIEDTESGFTLSKLIEGLLGLLIICLSIFFYNLNKDFIVKPIFSYFNLTNETHIFITTIIITIITIIVSIFLSSILIMMIIEKIKTFLDENIKIKRFLIIMTVLLLILMIYVITS